MCPASWEELYRDHHFTPHDTQHISRAFSEKAGNERNTSRRSYLHVGLKKKTTLSCNFDVAMKIWKQTCKWNQQPGIQPGRGGVWESLAGWPATVAKVFIIANRFNSQEVHIHSLSLSIYPHTVPSPHTHTHTFSLFSKKIDQKKDTKPR